MASLRSSRAYSNLQVESIRYQRSALPAGSTGSFLILDENGVVTFGTDAKLNSLTLESLVVTQGITTGSLYTAGSITAHNLRAVNNVTAANGTVGTLRVTDQLIVEGITITPVGTSVVEALYIFAGATSVPLSGFQGYNLDVSGSAIFRGGLTMGGPLAATNTVTVRGGDAQLLFENAAGVTVGSIQGLATGMFIESDHKIVFSNLADSPPLLTIDPVAPAVTVEPGVTLNVRAIGGAGITVSAPATFTGAATTNGTLTMNGAVTANRTLTVATGATLQVNSVLDVRGSIQNTLPGGLLNLNDSTAVGGSLNVQGVVQQGSVLGTQGLTLQLQPTVGAVSIGNAGATVAIIGTMTTARGVIIGGGLTVSNLLVGSGGLTTTSGVFGSDVVVSGGLTVSNLLVGSGGLTTTSGVFGSDVTVGSTLFTNAIQNVSGNLLSLLPVGVSSNITLELAANGGNVTIGSDSAPLSSGISARQFFSAVGGAYVGGNFGLQIAQTAPGSISTPFDGSGAVIGWNSIESTSGNMELILGKGGIATGGGLNIWNTPGVTATQWGSKILALDNGGNMTLGGGLTLSGGPLSTNGIQPYSGTAVTITANGGTVVFDQHDTPLSSVTPSGRMLGTAVVGKTYLGVNATTDGSTWITVDPTYSGMYLRSPDSTPSATKTELALIRVGTTTATSFLIFDTLNNRMGVLNASPAATLDVNGTVNVTGAVTVNGGFGSSTTTGVTFTSPIATSYAVGAYSSTMITAPSYTFYYKDFGNILSGTSPAIFGPWVLEWNESYVGSVGLNGYVAPVAGIYQLGAYVTFTASDSNASIYFAWGSGSSVASPLTAQTGVTQGTCSLLVKLAAGDEVTVGLNYSTASGGANTDVQMWGYLVHAL